jgi:hypothetical protein
MDKKIEALTHNILGELRKINHALRDLCGGPRKQNVKAVSRQGHSDNEDQGTERDSIAASHTNPTQCQTNEPYYRWYNPKYWREVVRSSTRKEIIEVIGIFFVIGYAVITFFQWQEMKKQTVGANRAWIFITRAMPEIEKTNSVIAFNVDYIDVGKSPATSLNWKLENGLVAPPQTTDWSQLKIERNSTCDDLMPNDTSGDALFPDYPQGRTPMWRAPSNPAVFMNDDIRTRTHLLFVKGCVAYRTMGKIGRSSFCRAYTPVVSADGSVEWQWAKCPISSVAE